MHVMFSGASAFKQNIGVWTIYNLTELGCMFYDTTTFNQNI